MILVYYKTAAINKAAQKRMNEFQMNSCVKKNITPENHV